MNNSWTKTTLEEVCIRITDGAHASPKSVVSGLPMASVKDLTQFGINMETCCHISTNDFNKLVRQGCKPEVGDILISKDGASDSKIISAFVHHVSPLLQNAYILNKKNVNLRRTRNLLLPKLISGEVDVEKLDMNIPTEAV